MEEVNAHIFSIFLNWNFYWGIKNALHFFLSTMSADVNYWQDFWYKAAHAIQSNPWCDTLLGLIKEGNTYLQRMHFSASTQKSGK